MPTLIIDYIGKQPQLIPVIAQWHQDQWQLISPDQTTESRIKQYSAYSSSGSIPFCLVATRGNRAVGSASIVESDMDTRPELSPWLASVYVDKPYRNQGVASELISRCIHRARQSGIETLYLFTPDQADFYRRRGWKWLQTVPYHNEQVDIMSFDLSR